ncbi:MAG: hypothetical protein ABR507_02720 [Actinomycetota bacterium]
MIIAAYLFTGTFGTRLGLPVMRPIFDGLAPPQPYRWVNPPPEFKDGNSQPASARELLPIATFDTQPQTVSTDDAQVILTLPKGSVGPKEGETSLLVTIVPLDPATLPPAPKGLSVQGNAYEVKAVYEKTSQEAELLTPPTLIIRFPVDATKILQLDGKAWKGVTAQYLGGALQLYAEPKRIGTFVAAVPISATSPPATKKPKRTPLFVYILAGTGLALTALWIGLTRKRSASRPKSKAPRKHRKR